MADILGRPLMAAAANKEARGNVQRVIRTATGMNILTSVAGCGGFQENNAIFDQNSSEIDKTHHKSHAAPIVVGDRTPVVRRKKTVASN